MEKYIVSYETAVKLKEIGFNEECFQSYECGGISVCTPLYDQVFEWFRDKKNLFLDVSYNNPGGSNEYDFTITDLFEEKPIHHSFTFGGSSYDGTFDTYEEARQKGIDWIINHLKEDNGRGI